MRATMGMLAAGLVLAAEGAAAAAPLNYDCDTGDGHFSELSQVQAGSAYRLRGTITPLRWGAHERWAPSAQIRLENGSRSIAVRLMRAPGEPRATFSIEVSSGGEPQRTLLGRVGLNEVLPFDLSLGASGDAAVQVGTERRTFHLDLGPNAKVSAVCSTGDFLFGGLDLGG
jgi:hypothetical protein